MPPTELLNERDEHKRTNEVRHATLDDFKKLKLSESRVLSTYGDIGLPYAVIDDKTQLHKVKVCTFCINYKIACYI